MTEPTAADGHTGPDGAEGGRDAAGPEGRIIAIAVTVTRTGGFAGMRRTWRAQPDRTEAPQWIALIDGCPWDAADPNRDIVPTGADRYMWHVDARCGDSAREAALADPEVQGPWRALIDAVREAKSGGRPPASAR